MRFTKTLTGAVLAGCLAVLTPSAAGATVVRPTALTEPASLLALYDFSESNGTVLRDSSAAHRDAAVVGGAAWRSGAMQFTGSNYVQLPNDLLAGKSAATIVIETTPQALAGAKFLWNFGGSGDSSTGQFFIQPIAPRLAISKTNWSGEQTVTSATKLVEGRSQSVAATIEKNTGGTTSTLRLFIDGTQVAAKTDSTVHLSDLLTHTMNYIGKSAYGGDSLYQGKVSTFRVYQEALPVTTLVEIAATDAQQVAAETAAAIDLAAVNAQNLDAVASNLVLPTAGGVIWSSSQPGVVAADGTVVQPASNTVVTLTAAASVRGQSASREFTVTVLAAPDAAEQAARAAAALVVPSVLEEGYVLPATALGLPVVWSHVSGAGSIEDGAIAGGPESGMADATLEATVGSGADAATAQFQVRIIEVGAARIATYTTSKNTRGGDDPEVTRSAHLALSVDGGAFAPLNSGAGVVFPSVSGMTEQVNGIKRYLADPYLFRLKGDEGFGIIARRVNAAGAADGSGALVFTSPDLVHWTEIDFLPLTGQAAGPVSAEWDAEENAYRVIWTAPNGSALAGTTTSFDAVQYLGVGQHPSGRSAGIGVGFAETATVIPLTAAEAGSTDGLLGRVHNTAVQAPASVTVEVGGSLELPEKVAAEYSDGGTHDFRVTWDTSGVDLSTPGEYTVSGSLKTTDTNFPLLKNRADPHVLRYTRADGEKTWLFIATDDAGQDEFFIRSADTVAGLASAPDNRILGYGLSGTSVNAQLWAPELHVVDGDLFVLFAANANSVNGWNGVQSYTMRLKPGGDPLVRADWQAPQRVVDAAGNPLTTYGTGITLDMTHFEDQGDDYVVWSERNVPSTGIGPAVLKIAKVAPSATGAWKLIGERSTIVQPDKGWSANTAEVAEGPFVIQRDGKIMITFSGSGIDWTYAVGLATAASGADLLDPASWGIRDYPIWHYEGAFTNNWGPGHNSYTYDDDGNLLNVFHARATQNGSRDAGVRMVYFRQDGSPILDMTDAEWLAAENRTVTTTVTVEGPALDVSASAATRCVAGKVVLAVRIGNAGETAVDATISSGYGQATASGIESSKTVSIATRSASIPGGDVTVTVTGDVDGQAATVQREVSYPARACS
ncbi:family 43 glycosylhydrolase [Microbacterium sp. LWH12-1.2]|uniref:family 43 glycosylhydrolase n=1 Tax=Microbacterium sp. LWH12-1.2 TaxID=3135259 RepID=UPI0034397EDD